MVLIIEGHDKKIKDNENGTHQTLRGGITL
ncbi:hypothetical protein V6Z12_D01G032500 [Gossypium hirsutum]